MDIVIFHYHLNPGGVTRIIESQVPSIKLVLPNSNVKILCGYSPNVSRYTNMGAEVIVDKNLDYLPEGLTEHELQNKFNYILTFFKQHIKKDGLLHMHNLNLGKNPVITYAAYHLAKEGFKIVNHIHDFAEDRPQNWQFLSEIIQGAFNEKLESVLYPSLKNYVFATLTLSDLNRLMDYDIKCNRKYFLPNPVNLGTLNANINKKHASNKLRSQFNFNNAKKVFTYPVRVIQRKNIGEYILLAALFSGEAYWLVTQPPKNPKEVVKYNEWKHFCKENNIDVIFEAGLKADFETILTGSDACITTSIREGFGMVYLEPWLNHTPVIGRELKYVVQDFKDRGLEFPFLYDAIYVNNEGDITDFKDLSADKQKQVILKISDKVYKEEFFTLNPNLKNIFNVISDDIITRNKNLIINHYSLEKFGERLYGIYQKIVD